jgi:Co/Zn/Cd efflux system component
VREVPVKAVNKIFVAGYMLVTTVFRLLHEDPARLPQASTIGIAAAALLIAWGAFIRFNKSAEEIEPEAMARTKSEDAKVS